MNLREWISGQFFMLQEAVYKPLSDFTLWWTDSFKKELAAGVILVLETLEPELQKACTPVVSEMLKNPEISPAQRKLLENSMQPTHPINVLVVWLAMAVNVFGFAGAASAGLAEKIRQESMGDQQAGLLSPDELILCKWRGVSSELDIMQHFTRQGYSPVMIKALFDIRRYVPQANDLIRFTVRDVFREDIVQRYGYDTDYDRVSASLEPWLKKVGMDADVMKLYWRAHWELPSLNQAYELLHRRFINQDDIRQLLKIADMAPYFIEPLIKASYNPYTRVDVRRMYAAGVLTEAQVFDAYQDIGYDLDHARKLTDWTTKSIQGAEIKLSKAIIESAYRKGQIQRPRALSELDELGYSPEDAELVMSLLDADMDQKWVDEQLKTLHSEALKGVITLDAYKQSLAKFEIPEKRIAWMMDKLAIDLRKNRKSPEKADIKLFYLASLISDRVAVDMLLTAGYDVDTANLYLNAWTSGPSGSE